MELDINDLIVVRRGKVTTVAKIDGTVIDTISQNHKNKVYKILEICFDVVVAEIVFHVYHGEIGKRVMLHTNELDIMTVTPKFLKCLQEGKK